MRGEKKQTGKLLEKSNKSRGKQELPESQNLPEVHIGLVEEFCSNTNQATVLHLHANLQLECWKVQIFLYFSRSTKVTPTQTNFYLLFLN